MKKQLFLLAGLMLCVAAFAQNSVNLVIFSDDGDAFYAFVNGVKQNYTAETNVKLTNLSPNISLRIEFEDKALPQLKQTMALDPGFEHTARIKRDAKKQLKLRYFGSVPLNQAVGGVPTVEYHTAEDPDAGGSVQNETPVNGTGSTSYTTVTYSGTSQSNPGSVSININMPGVNMQVDAMDPNMSSGSSTTVTSSSSYQSSSSTPTNDYNTTNDHRDHAHNRSHSGCSGAMSPASFSKMKESVESKPFSDTKMSTAKVATKNNCLSVSQIKTIASLFSMDDDRLTYAKFAYDYCVDKGNYYQVSEVFKFSGTTDELNNFLGQ